MCHVTAAIEIYERAVPEARESVLLCNLRLAHICRRRMQRTFAMDRLGTVAVVQELI